MVSEPASSVLRAEAKIWRGFSRARTSRPPVPVRLSRVRWAGHDVAMTVFVLLPVNRFHRGRLTAVYSPKSMTLMRITFITVINCGLGWASFVTERSAVLNYVTLWIAPMFTTTAVLMIVRHWQQHGEIEGESHGLRDPQPGLLGRFILFPLNQRYHREKHSSPSKPWFRLGDSSCLRSGTSETVPLQ